MINQQKNVCYVNEVRAVNADGKEYYQKFLSRHGLTTQRFKSFAENYLHDKGCKIYSQMSGEYEWGAQDSISRKEWQDPAIRERVLMDITEAEKCY